MSKRRAIKVARFKCVLCGGEYRSADTADKCVGACSERDRVDQAIKDGTLARTEEQLDHEDMVAEQSPDVREVKDADVDAAVEANGELADPEECFADAMDEAQRLCMALPAGHAVPLERALRLAYQSVMAIIRLRTVVPSTDVDELMARGSVAALDAIAESLRR